MMGCGLWFTYRARTCYALNAETQRAIERRCPWFTLFLIPDTRSSESNCLSEWTDPRGEGPGDSDIKHSDARRGLAMHLSRTHSPTTLGQFGLGNGDSNSGSYWKFGKLGGRGIRKKVWAFPPTERMVFLRSCLLAPMLMYSSLGDGSNQNERTLERVGMALRRVEGSKFASR